jgi:hypothetical protein
MINLSLSLLSSLDFTSEYNADILTSRVGRGIYAGNHADWLLGINNTRGVNRDNTLSGVH